MILREKDVYKFFYNEEYKNSCRFDPYHCFDGQLIVRKRNDGTLYLEDTYWSAGDNKIFSLEEALQKGTLQFKCNLNDIEPCSESDSNYYKPEDLFDLSTQHRCYQGYYKKKDAIRSPEIMRNTIERKIEESKHKIQWEECTIERLNENLKKLESGDTDFYI